MSVKHRLHIAICGGGIGGLALAVILNKFSNDVEIDLYESAPQFTQVGAGISVWKRTWYIIKLLGLDEDLGKMAITPPVDAIQPGFILRKSDQREDGFNFHQIMTPYGSITLHRADMLKVLTDNLPPSSRFHTHFSKRLITHSFNRDSSTVTMRFMDGSSATADVLIGADGIKSATRVTMYTNLASEAEKKDPVLASKLRGFKEASWTGTYAYRALIDTKELLKAHPGHIAATNPLICCGKDKHIVSYPISQGRLVNLVPFVTIPGGEGRVLEGPAVTDVPKEEVLQHFKGWEPAMQELLQCMSVPSRWAISHIRDLPHYADGNVAIIGDAAHAMTTHLGAGAAQAIEDAFILGRLLSDKSVTKANVPDILQIYDAVRRPFGNAVVERARLTGFLYEFNNVPPGISVQKLMQGDKEELQRLSKEIEKKWELMWASLPDKEWNEAEALLKTKLKQTSPEVAARL